MADDDKPQDKPVDGGKLGEVHAEALKRLNETWSVEQQNVANGREDQRFYAGDQWDEASKRARGTTRPMLTIPRIKPAVRQLTGDIRQNPPAIKVLPAKGKASQEIADILNGVIRDIEAESDATACYVTAADNTAQTGQGAWRIVAEYDGDSFDQELRIRPIRDPFGFLIGPAELPDKSDMEFAWVFQRMPNDAFRAKYPDKALDDIPLSNAAVSGTLTFSWRTGDTVRIAEYWRKVKTTRKVKNEDREREVTDTKVEMYLMSGADILSGPHPWAGKDIPICVMSGEESVVDGATVRIGMVRDAKDAQRLYNYSRTAAAEAIAIQPKMPWLVTEDMIAGYEDEWDRAGTDNLPYLRYKPDKANPTGVPKRAEPALAQNGLDGQAAMAAEDIEAAMGIYAANLGAEGQEKSGRAIIARQRQGDTGTFIYIDNLRRAISYCGRCLCDLIPKIYDGERIVRMLKEDGSHEMVPINARAPAPDATGNYPVLNDLSIGKYSVQVSTGPSYLTRRQEQAATLVELASKMPIVGQVAPDLLVKAIDFPGGEELAARLERTVPPQLREEEGAPQPPPPPPPPDVVAKAEKDAATADKTRAEAEGQKLENATLAMQLQAQGAQLAAIMQMMQSGQMPIGQPGPTAPPPMAPPAAPPMPSMAGMPAAPPPPPDLEPIQPQMPAMEPPPPASGALAEMDLEPIEFASAPEPVAAPPEMAAEPAPMPPPMEEPPAPPPISAPPPAPVPAPAPAAPPQNDAMAMAILKLAESLTVSIQDLGTSMLEQGDAIKAAAESNAASLQTLGEAILAETEMELPSGKTARARKVPRRPQ